ncbi:hypothetical protein NQ315_013752 [Exocentrus adspersus]|uniref:DDE-1 domain-containing protein n=1 Tax=Exocentrus adspersus TaxID=1586481 RepID=A0AAV8W459_9CUCU|nr:hypothetical protein NQ315_013752 [Exocentrus adspersus]
MGRIGTKRRAMLQSEVLQFRITTHHGWMHSQTFTEWLESCFFPHAKRLPGRKVLLGVQQECNRSEVLLAFVCLPKKSIHLTQPLDVGFFRPFKNTWRKVLTNWKAAHKQLTSIDKKDFPYLLASTLVEMEITSDNATSSVHFKQQELYQYILSVFYAKFHSADKKKFKTPELTVEPGRSVTASNDNSRESDVDEPVTNDNSDDKPFDEDIQEVVRQESEYFELRLEDIEVGKFVPVKVLGGSRKKSVYRYVAVV